MLEFPVDVSKSDSGDYVARLIDLPDGPSGQGIDPYAALEDLTGRAQDALRQLNSNDELPSPSPVEDRPVIQFDSQQILEQTLSQKPLMVGKGDQSQMIGYSWTNHVVFPDN